MYCSTSELKRSLKIRNATAMDFCGERLACCPEGGWRSTHVFPWPPKLACRKGTTSIDLLAARILDPFEDAPAVTGYAWPLKSDPIPRRTPDPRVQRRGVDRRAVLFKHCNSRPGRIDGWVAWWWWLTMVKNCFDVTCLEPAKRRTAHPFFARGYIYFIALVVERKWKLFYAVTPKSMRCISF